MAEPEKDKGKGLSNNTLHKKSPSSNNLGECSSSAGLNLNAIGSAISSEPTLEGITGDFYPATHVYGRRSIVPVKPPNSRGSQGRQLLALTVQAAIERATLNGNTTMAHAVERMYQKSLSEPLLAELMDAVLAQRATPEQILQFKAYSKNVEVMDKPTGMPDFILPGTRAMEKMDAESAIPSDRSRDRDSPMGGMGEVELQTLSVSQTQSSGRQEQATNNEDETMMEPVSMDTARNFQTKHSLKIPIKRAQIGYSSSGKPSQPTSTPKESPPSSSIKSRTRSGQRMNKTSDTSENQVEGPQAKFPKDSKTTRLMSTHLSTSAGASEGHEGGNSSRGDGSIRHQNDRQLSQVSSDEHSPALGLAATNPLVGNINALKSKLIHTPNSKTALGREALSIVVNRCVERSDKGGISAVGQAIKKFYDESLSNPSRAEFLDKLFAGNPPKEQVRHFQTYVREFVQSARAKDSQPTRSITDGGQSEIRDTITVSSPLIPKPIDKNRDASASNDRDVMSKFEGIDAQTENIHRPD